MGQQFMLARARQTLTADQVPAFLEWIRAALPEREIDRNGIKEAVTYLYVDMDKNADFATETFGVHGEPYFVTGGLSQGEEPTTAYEHIKLLDENEWVFDAFDAVDD